VLSLGEAAVAGGFEDADGEGRARPLLLVWEEESEARPGSGGGRVRVGPELDSVEWGDGAEGVVPPEGVGGRLDWDGPFDEGVRVRCGERCGTGSGGFVIPALCWMAALRVKPTELVLGEETARAGGDGRMALPPPRPRPPPPGFPSGLLGGRGGGGGGRSILTLFLFHFLPSRFLTFSPLL